MPKSWRRYFRAVPLHVHFSRALALGFALRMLCAFFVYGPQALDDYKHGVWPAYEWFAGIPSSLPLYRSPLLVWLLGSFTYIASMFGWTSALSQVRAMYVGLGLVSLSGIYGAYLYARLFRSRTFGAAAIYLVAAFPLIPFVGTRAFGEAVALALVVLAMGWLETSRRERLNSWHWLQGFLILGVAALFRFHVGLMYVVYLGVLLFLKEWKGARLGLVTGLLLVGLEAAIDLLAGREALSTLHIYISENEGGAAKYGVSPWYNPLLFVLAVSLAPFSIFLWRYTRGLWRKHWPLLFPAVIFLVAHMFVAHKEERFLYPILGIELLALADLSARASRGFARRYLPIVAAFTIFLLPFLTLVNSQEGEIEPPALLESRYTNVLYLDFESLFGQSRFKFYFLRPPSVLESITLGDFNAHRIEEGLSQHADAKAAAFVTSNPEGLERMKMIEGLDTIQAQCGRIQSSGSLMDRLLYALNPKHNQRRRPTWYLVCERRSKDGK